MTVKVTWLGHACIQLDYEDTTILIDPWIGNPKFPGDAYKPKKIDLMLITHGHNDHFGNAVELAKEFKPTIPVMHEMSVYLQKIGIENAIGMNFGGTVEFKGIKVTMVPSSHSGGYNDDNGNMHYLGNPGGYVLTFPDGHVFYHSGDTGVTNDLKIISELFKPTIAFLCIGGHYTMDPKGAAYAAKMMDLKQIIPIHWGTFVPPLVGTPEELKNNLTNTNINVIGLSPGDSHTF